MSLTKLTPVSMDDMFREAMRLGRVKLEQDYHGSFEATIQFTRPSGTTIYARGKNSDAWFAMGMAIYEARDMGAVEIESHAF